jgi:hypothetical protein
VALNTLDEREYRIEDPGSEARDLHAYLRQRVLITGTVLGNRVVRITAIKVRDFPESIRRARIAEEPE